MRGRKQKASAGRFPCTAALRRRRAPLSPMRDPPTPADRRHHRPVHQPVRGQNPRPRRPLARRPLVEDRTGSRRARRGAFRGEASTAFNTCPRRRPSARPPRRPTARRPRRGWRSATSPRRMQTFFRLFNCGPFGGAKPEEEGGSKDVPVPPATKEPVEDQQVSASISADTNDVIEAAMSAAGSQVGAPEAEAEHKTTGLDIRTQSFETTEEEQAVSTPPSRPADAITASLD